jgi:hypothetical protein
MGVDDAQDWSAGDVAELANVLARLAEAERLLDQVAALFPKGLRLPLASGGVLTISQPVRIMPGFQDVADYRRVAQVFYDASFIGTAPDAVIPEVDEW